MIDTTHRSAEKEWMDDASLSGKELTATLDQIAVVNKTLGGNSVTLNGVKKLLKITDNLQTIHIIDLGCGNGDMLRTIAIYGRKKNLTFKLTGIDINEATIEHAKSLSKNFSEIEFLEMDFFSPEFKKLKFDIALATLVAHHLTDAEIIQLLTNLTKTVTRGIVVNDLHRNSLAYYLFKLIGIFVKSKRAHQDGLISILRGFKRHELITLSNELNVQYRIKWKWAFRYQWIIRK